MCIISVWKKGKVVLVDSKEFRPRKDPLVGNLVTVAFTKEDLDNMPEGTWVAIVVCLAFPGVQVLYDSVGKPISAIDPGKELPIVWLWELGCWFPKTMALQCCDIRRAA